MVMLKNIWLKAVDAVIKKAEPRSKRAVPESLFRSRGGIPWHDADGSVASKAFVEMSEPTILLGGTGVL